MTKIITFSQQFPVYHRRKQQRTYFVEQVLNALKINYRIPEYLELLFEINAEKIADPNCKLTRAHVERFFCGLDVNIRTEKIHTIRAGERFIHKEVFAPCIWSSKPYQSPQIQFAPKTIVQRIYGFELGIMGSMKVNETPLVNISKIACNDGLSSEDFKDWFRIHPKKTNKGFEGTIISWLDHNTYAI